MRITESHLRKIIKQYLKEQIEEGNKVPVDTNYDGYEQDKDKIKYYTVTLQIPGYVVQQRLGKKLFAMAYDDGAIYQVISKLVLQQEEQNQNKA
jgi:hypothetical protein